MANHFGKTLSRLRAERGLSQQELAAQQQARIAILQMLFLAPKNEQYSAYY